MHKRIGLFVCLTVMGFLSCQPKGDEQPPPRFERSLNTEEAISTIAFGSCNRQDRAQVIWSAILENDPDLWIWLGDNIYADTEDMALMEALYKQQKFDPHYTRFRKNVPVIGIWDDHDYGVNDGDKHYPKKEESKQLMLDFLDVPDSALVREREGAYQAYTFGPAGKRVKILLLDERYFRDELKPNPGGDSRYLPNSHGDVLGEAQWAWLERELRKNEAQIHIIAGGIQVIAEEQGFEKWANFPSARRRFFKLLTETRPSHPILLSGDRHIAELSRITLDGLSAPLYELTASGMTHTWSSEWEEPNRYRVGEMVIARNYGLMYIDWSSGEPSVRIEVRGIDNELHLRHLLF